MAHNYKKRVEIIESIYKERERQEIIHPECKGDLHFLAILIEEIGEVAQALQENTNLEEELVQCAAVICRWIENRDK